MSGASGQPTPATISLGQQIHFAYEVGKPHGVTHEHIMRAVGLGNSQYNRVLAAGRQSIAGQAGLRIVASGEPDGAADISPPEIRLEIPPPAKPRKMGAATLAHRLYKAKTGDRRLRSIEAYLREFWSETIMEIREHGHDGIELLFVEGTLYPSQREFLDDSAITADDLARLFRLGLLVDLAGQGLAIPDLFDLRPKPKRVRATGAGHTDAIIASENPNNSAPYTRQPSISLPISGGLNGPADSRRRGESLAEKTAAGLPSGGVAGGVPTPVSSENRGESRGVAQAAAAAAKELIDIESSSSSSSSTTPLSAREGSPVAAEKTPPDSRRDAAEKTPPGSPPDAALAALRIEVATLAELGRPLDAAELAMLDGWLARGMTREGIVAAIQEVLRRPNRPRTVTKLGFFDGRMRDEVDKLRRSAAGPVAKPPELPSKVSKEQEALRKRWHRAATMKQRWSSAPMGPTFQQLTDHREIGPRWLDEAEAWEKGRYSGERPLDFTAYLAAHSPPH